MTHEPGDLPKLEKLSEGKNYLVYNLFNYTNRYALYGISIYFMQNIENAF